MKNIFLKYVIFLISFIFINCRTSYTDDYDYPDEDGECHAPYWSDDWEYDKFISFLDDSIAVYKTIRSKTEYYKYLFVGDIEEKCVPFLSDRHIGLWLANYRTKQEPILIDTLDYDLNIISGLLKDSSLLVIKDNKFAFWKIEKNSKDRLDSNVFKEINFLEAIYFSTIKRANSWTDGNILLTDDSYTQRLVLNPSTVKIEELNTSRQNEWLNSCKDISYVNGKVICIRFNYTDIYWELVVDGIVSDTKKIANGILLNSDQMYYSSKAFLEKNKWLSKCYNILYIDDELICKSEDKSIDNIIISYDSAKDMENLWKDLFDAIMNFHGGNYAIMKPGNFGEVRSDELIKIDSENFKFDNTFKSILEVDIVKYSTEDFTIKPTIDEVKK